MPEAAARARHDPALRFPSRSPRAAGARLLAAALRRLRAAPARGYAAGALIAALAGIVVNALTLQHERHPAPFFAAHPPAAAAPAVEAKANDAPPTPPSRPNDLGGAADATADGRDAIGDLLRVDAAADGRDAIGDLLRADAAAEGRGGDAIGDLLRADAGADGRDAIGGLLRADADKEAQEAILAAQNALIKLGYPLKADGAPGAATSAALRDFERAHSLPLSTEVTPRLLRQLTAAAAGR